MIDYIIEQLKALEGIDSPTGFTRKAAEYVINEFTKLGFNAKMTTKGCVLVDFGGNKEGEGLILSAHIDTLGGMVQTIKSNGRLVLTAIGGFQPNNGEAETCRIYTRDGRVYDGTFQLNDASVHVNGEYSSKKREYSSMEVVIDEKSGSKMETEALGISNGDYVCFDPRTVVTKSGFIKSRFLDDKLSVAIILGFAKYLRDNNITVNRPLYAYITAFEEVGHGCSGEMPEEVKEILCVDMGCVGDGLECKEWQVSICAKDSSGPSNYDMTTELINLAKKNNIDFAVDIYPHYGSDADAALRAGHDLRHSLIGAGVYASHGYERSHIDGVKNTLELIKAYALR